MLHVSFFYPHYSVPEVRGDVVSMGRQPSWFGGLSHRLPPSATSSRCVRAASRNGVADQSSYYPRKGVKRSPWRPPHRMKGLREHEARGRMSVTPHCVTTEDRATIVHSSAERASVRNPASANADERAQRAGIAVGLMALVLEGTFAILSLAAVAFITSAFLASWAVSAGALLLPRLGRSIRCQVR